MNTACLQLPGQLRIGTSGWSYPHWRAAFYHDIETHGWLNYYARHFSTVEINASFYRTQKQMTLEHWRTSTPATFDFTVKGHRYISHNKKLRNCTQAIRNEQANYAALGEQLAAVLWQLPQNLHINTRRLAHFATALQNWPVTHIIEFRHPSWFCQEVADILAEFNIVNCLSDAADWPLWSHVTQALVYIRLHGHTRTYQSAYATASLQAWSDRILAWLDQGLEVRVYFDNDADGHAIHDALHLCQLLAKR